MSPLGFEFHPRAVKEARAARRWYARRSRALADRFLTELDRAIAQILLTPDQWPPYLQSTRVYRLRRFPYLLVYRHQTHSLQVVAVAHSRRRPGYWLRRLR